VIEPRCSHHPSLSSTFVFFFLFLMIAHRRQLERREPHRGWDGLAIGLMLVASGAMTALTYTTGHAEFAEVPWIWCVLPLPVN